LLAGRMEMDKIIKRGAVESLLLPLE
jgi:hypothetical protein